MQSNETPFNAEENEIEYEQATTAQATTVERLAAENATLRAELATANATIAQLTDDLTEAAQVADADNETVAALVSRIEDEKVTALRAEIAAANAKVAKLEEENSLLRNWLMMETGVDEQHVNDVLSDDADLSDKVKNRYG